MNGLSTAAQIALVLLGILAAVGVVALVVLLLQVRRIGKDLSRQSGPLLDRGKVIAANLEYISATVRTDVEHLNTSVKALSDRLQHASDRMEERIEDFNALMEVVQGEAEGMFLDTAATVRGLKAGARSLAAPGEAWEPEDDAEAPEAPDTTPDPSSERTA